MCRSQSGDIVATSAEDRFYPDGKVSAQGTCQVADTFDTIRARSFHCMNLRIANGHAGSLLSVCGKTPACKHYGAR